MRRSRAMVVGVFVVLCATCAVGVPSALSLSPVLVELGTGAFLRVDGGQSQAGMKVSGAGDVNGDGLADVLVGTSPLPSTEPASVHLVFGRTSPGIVDLTALGGSGFGIEGARVGDVSGAGDVNHDGLADVVLGAPESNRNGRTDSGSAYVVFGKASPTTVDLAALGAEGFRIDGASPGDAAGTSVSGAGDVNGDGVADVLVGAPLTDNDGRDRSGSAYVVFGKASPTTVDLAALGASGFRIDGAGVTDHAGVSVSGAGDVNGDGRADVVLGAPIATVSSGHAYVVFGRASTARVELRALGADGFRIDDSSVPDHGEVSVSGAGDVNGDGPADVLVSVVPHVGRTSTYLVFGKASTTAVDLAHLGRSGFEISGGAFGVGGGDVNGDGFADVLMGAPYANPYGSAYVVYGSVSPKTINLASLGFAGLRIDGGAASGAVGDSIASAGDVNGDGLADVLVGAPDRAGVRSHAGRTYVITGSRQRCADYVLIDSRGSGRHSPVSATGARLLAAWKRLERSANVVPNVYPARRGVRLVGGRIKAPPSYPGSVAAGKENLKAMVTALLAEPDCRSTKLLLTGHSQGAQVTGDVYYALAKERPAGFARIIGVALFGDPRFNSRDTAVARGNPRFLAGRNGALGARKPFPRATRGRVLSFCHSGDRVCQRGAKVCACGLGAHENYHVRGEPEAAVRAFAKNRTDEK